MPVLQSVCYMSVVDNCRGRCKHRWLYTCHERNKPRGYLNRYQSRHVIALVVRERWWEDNWDVSRVKSMWDIGPNCNMDHIPKLFWTQTTRNSATRRNRTPFLLFIIIVEHYCLCQLNVLVFFCLVFLLMQQERSGVKRLNTATRGTSCYNNVIRISKWIEPLQHHWLQYRGYWNRIPCWLASVYRGEPVIEKPRDSTTEAIPSDFRVCSNAPGPVVISNAFCLLRIDSPILLRRQRTTAVCCKIGIDLQLCDWSRAHQLVNRCVHEWLHCLLTFTPLVVM